MKKAGFGFLRLKPDEFWSLTATELGEMYEAVYLDDKEKFEVERQLTAWQTAMLMNSTGNYKQPVTVEKLIGKSDDENEPTKGGNVVVDRDEKNKKIEELKNKFK